MTQEEKDLLLKDLCARLTWGVKVSCLRDLNHKWYNLKMVDIDDNEVYLTTDEPYTNRYAEIETVKPYLFPMSSMTEEQCYELGRIRSTFTDNWKYIKTPIPLYIANYSQVDWLNAHYFDYRGLIEKGLAIDATSKKIY